MNHTCKCLNIRLQCFRCDYSVESAKAINSHVAKEHSSEAASCKMELSEVSQVEVEEVIAAIAHGQQK